jgi:nucleotide-binding universal stress UspA family protein
MPQMIIRRYEKEQFQLMIIPSKRRSKRIDKFLWNSVSAQVIPKVGIDVLQIYSKKKTPQEIILNDIACLIPFSNRDPYLLRWATAIITSKIGTNPLIAYHVDEYPPITPIDIASKDPDYLRHKLEFETRMKYFSKRYSVEMKTQMVIGKNMQKTLEQVLNKVKLDLVIMGATKIPPRSHFGRTMSEKLIDKLKCGVVIHHWRVSPKNK